MHREIRKRCLAIFLSLVIVLGLIPGIQQAKAASITAPTINGADGTQLHPYIIDEPDDLLWIASEVNNTTNTFTGKYFLQTDDIDMTGISWAPIGFDTSFSLSASNTFGGIYDGNGHTISNVNCTSTHDCFGFFGSTREGSEIKNLNISNITINYTADNTNSKYIGAIVGGGYSIITNCQASGSIFVASDSCTMCIGGIAGWAAKAISKCTSEVFATSNNDKAKMGGIAGSLSASIDNCVFAGTLKNTATSTLGEIGGIAGYICGGTVKHCFFYGSLDTNATTEGPLVGNYYSGTISKMTTIIILRVVIHAVTQALVLVLVKSARQQKRILS